MPEGRAPTVLFDLDGTLADTAPDLAAALNDLLQSRGRPPLPPELTRPQASHGTRGLLGLGFGVGPEHPEFDGLRQEYLARYALRLLERTTLFPGMADVLDRLESDGRRWGVVTNKPTCYTLPLLAHLGLAARAACVVCGDTLAWNKPHPAPLVHACRLACTVPVRCWYVGDAQRDVAAARAAGMPALVALYGYLDAADRPQDWGAQGYIHQPGELLERIG